MLADDLRRAIKDLGETAYSLSAATGVSASVISRFLNGERDLRLETAGKIAAHLELELAPKRPQ